MNYTNREFNPSQDPRVDAIKQAAEDLAEIITLNCPWTTLREKALLDVQSASMFAVKSLFTK